VKELESRLRNKDQELLSVYCRSTERNQELLRHHDHLREAEEATTAKTCELQVFYAAKAQEIAGL
jgi:hypothetical protein